MYGHEHARDLPSAARPQRARPRLRAREPRARALQRRLEQMRGERIEIPLVIGGKDVTTGDLAHGRDAARQGARPRRRPPGRRRARRSRRSTRRPTAWEDWSRWPWEERAAVFLRAAELLAGPWRDTLNAATMLGQSKTAHQAEIDAACELIDFLRFNVEFMTRIYAEQPSRRRASGTGSSTGRSRASCFAVSPFNFTAIAGNLTSSPALMGNVVALEAGRRRRCSRPTT